MRSLTRSPSYADGERRTHTCASDGACRHPGALRARLPLAPLFEAARTTCQAELARCIGVNRRVLARWVVRGSVPAARADSCAVRLGFHPANLWPEWWTAA